MNNLTIGLAIFVIIISEIIYIILCSQETKKSLKNNNDWIFVKIASIVISLVMVGIITILFYGAYLALMNYIGETLKIATILIVVFGFFMINKKIGIAVAKK